MRPKSFSLSLRRTLPGLFQEVSVCRKDVISCSCLSRCIIIITTTAIIATFFARSFPPCSASFCEFVHCDSVTHMLAGCRSSHRIARPSPLHLQQRLSVHSSRFQQHPRLMWTFTSQTRQFATTALLLLSSSTHPAVCFSAGVPFVASRSLKIRAGHTGSLAAPPPTQAITSAQSNRKSSSGGTAATSSTSTVLRSMSSSSSTTATETGAVPGTVPDAAGPKLEALRSKMKELDLDVYIIPTDDPHLSEYTPLAYRRRGFLTDFHGSAGTAVVTQTEALLWTDSR